MRRLGFWLSLVAIVIVGSLSVCAVKSEIARHHAHSQ